MIKLPAVGNQLRRPSAVLLDDETLTGEESKKAIKGEDIGFRAARGQGAGGGRLVYPQELPLRQLASTRP